MVDLNAFALNVVQRLPVERLPDVLPPGFAVHLHEQATRLAELDASLAANMRFGSATAARSMRDRSAFAVIESAGQAAAEVDAEEIGTVALAEVAASPALADVTDRSDDLDGICPAGSRDAHFPERLHHLPGCRRERRACPAAPGMATEELRRRWQLHALGKDDARLHTHLFRA